ncbi:MAG: hypothetical protein KC656_21570, partial [Myxococcales bacterium]|nr:hypothetical protein [Myxococcales bacterium]
GFGASVAIGVAVAGLVVGLAWRGQDPGRGVVPGLFGGVVAWLLPLAWACQTGVCSASCTLQCAVVALGAGLAGGLVLHRTGGGVTALAAVAVAAGCASIGCVPLGSFGLLGVAGVLVAGLPAVRLSPA